MMHWCHEHGRRLGDVLAALLAVSHAVCWAEAPDVDALFPAGVRSGETAAVTLIGKPGSEPLDVWCSRDDVVFSPTDKPAEWTLSTAADARPGLCWVRFHNPQGASDLLPVVVGLLPEATETEPNNAATAVSEAVSLPVTINGRLNQSQDVDTFAVHLEAGQTLIASVDAHHLLGSPMDAVLQLLSPRGFVLEQSDDHHGIDPRIVYRAGRTETYYVRIFAFPADPNQSINFSSGETYVYRLTLTTGPFVDHVVPLSVSSEGTPPAARGWNLPEEGLHLLMAGDDEHPQFSLSVPTNLVLSRLPRVEWPALLEEALIPESAAEPLQVPVSITGHIARPDEVDVITFAGRKDQRLLISAEAQAFDSPLDPVLKVFGPDGKLLDEVDDESRSVPDARVSRTLPADGTYRVEIRDRFGHGDEWSVYLLTIIEDRPRFELSCADDALAVQAGQSLDIPVSVRRLGGFDGEISICMLDLPDDVHAAAVLSQAGGDTAEKVTLKVEAAAESQFRGPVRIIGTAGDAGPISASTRAPSAGLRIDSLWLTVTPPKD